MPNESASDGRQRPGRVAILRAAVSVMGEDGYDRASMRDMAARAGVSVAALYYHFPSKHDLLRQFLDEAWEVSLARIIRRVERVGDDPVAQLDEIVGTIIASNLHDDFAQKASRVALRDYTRLDPPERAVIERQRQRLVDLIAEVIAAGVESGDFTIDEPVAAAHAILTLTASVVVPRPLTRPMCDVIELGQRFARGIARS